METKSHDTSTVLGGAWHRLKGKGERQRRSRHKGNETGKHGKRRMLPFLLSYSFPPIHLTFFLYFSLISLPLPFLSPCRKQPFNGTAFHWHPHSCSSSPISHILHTVFLARHFYSGDIDRKFLQNICFLQTIYNHSPKAISWTLVRAPNLASVLSYPSNEIHESGIHEFHVLQDSYEHTCYVWILGKMKHDGSKILVCNGNIKNMSQYQHRIVSLIIIYLHSLPG